MPKVKSIAVIGCGAIAESYYLPALAADPLWKEMVWLIEPSDDRRSAMAKAFGIPSDRCAASLADFPALPDMAINCTPSHLHVATSVPLLEKGVHMIVEKPLAETAADAAALVAAAAKGGAVLSVNQHRRLGGSSRMIADYIRDGKLGTIRTVRWIEGRKFEWPTQSGFNFRRPWKGRPRGAVLDVGVHIVDLLTCWLDAPLTVKSAVMDGYGGPECYAKLALATKTAQVEVVLSFHAKLANTVEIIGDKGAIHAPAGDYDQFDYRPVGGAWKAIRLGPKAGEGLAKRLMGNVIAAAETGEPLIIEAGSVLSALTTIDAAYAAAVDPLPSCYGEWSVPVLEEKVA